MATIVEAGDDTSGGTYNRTNRHRPWDRNNRARSYRNAQGQRIDLDEEGRAVIMRRLLKGEPVKQIADEYNRSSAWVYHLYREFGYVVDRSESSMRLVHLHTAPPHIKERYQADLDREDAFPPPLDGIGIGEEIPFVFKSEETARAFQNNRNAFIDNDFRRGVKKQIAGEDPEYRAAILENIPASEETEVKTDIPADGLSDDQYIKFMDSVEIPLGGGAEPVTVPLSSSIELVDDPADVDGQLRVARQLQIEGMQLLNKQAEEIKEYKSLLVVSDNDIAQLKAEQDRLLDQYEKLVGAHDALAEKYRQIQQKNILLQQDADHWRAHKLAEDRRKSVESSKAVQEGNREYRQLLEKLRDKG